jgi:hypothetical protein
VNNKIIIAEQITEQAIRELREERPNEERLDHDAYRQRLEVLNTEAMIGFDGYFGIVKSVKYNDKTDKYVIEHQHGTAKCTDDVAEFLLAFGFNRSSRPTCHAQIVKGTVIAVALRYLSARD